MKLLAVVILTCILAFFLGYYVSAYRNSKINKQDPQTINSLDLIIDSLKQAYNESISVRNEIERKYSEISQANEKQLILYRNKIRNYEKELNDIDRIPLPSLMDSITSYYNRRHFNKGNGRN